MDIMISNPTAQLAKPEEPRWIDYAVLIIPIGQRTAANVAAAQTGNYFASDNDGATWDNAQELIAANAPDNALATFLMVGTLIRQATKDALPALQASFPGSRYYLESDGWDGQDIATILADAGLRVKPSEDLL